MSDLNLELILAKKLETWTPEEVHVLCERFIEACKDERIFPERLLTTRLWRYWFLIHGPSPMMHEPIFNMALMLSAQAFGDCVPPAGDIEYFSQYRQQHLDLEKLMTPPSFTWGPRACLNDVSGPTLNSAIINTYVFRRNEDEITEILIVGQGVPDIKQKVFKVALGCALRAQAGDLDMLNADIIRIQIPDEDQELFNIPGISTLGSQLPPTNAAGVLSGLVRELRLLQESTGLVVVHDNCDTDSRKKLDRELRGYAKQVSKESRCLILAKDPKKSPEVKGLVTLLPHYHIARRASPLYLKLDPDILENPSFKDLLDAFMHQTVTRIRVDAEVRLKSYEKHIEELTEEKQRWDDTADTPNKRKVLWDEYVLLTERFDAEVGVTIRLVNPEQRPTAEWMENSLPALIKGYKEWAEKMRQIIKDIKKTLERPDSPIRRLAAGSFLDAALRGCQPITDEPSVIMCFQRWSKQVAPFLQLQWRILLDSKGINPETVFRRNTTFHTRFQIDENNPGRVVGLLMQPLTLASPIHAVVAFDSSQPIISIQDPSDYSQPLQVEKSSEIPGLLNEIEHVLMTANSYEEIKVELKSLIRQSPQAYLSKITKYLFSFHRDPNSDWSESRLTTQKHEVRAHTDLAAFPSRVSTLLSRGATHSAKQLIQRQDIPEFLRVQLLLWNVLAEAYVESIIRNEPIHILILQARESKDLNDPIWELLNKAKSYDAQFVNEWLNLLKNAKDIGNAVSFLKRKWIRLEQQLSTQQKKAVYDAQSVVSLISLAKQLETESNAIEAGSESLATLLLKIGKSLEKLLLAETAGIPKSEVISLLEILVGEEATSY